MRISNANKIEIENTLNNYKDFSSIVESSHKIRHLSDIYSKEKSYYYATASLLGFGAGMLSSMLVCAGINSVGQIAGQNAIDTYKNSLPKVAPLPKDTSKSWDFNDLVGIPSTITGLLSSTWVLTKAVVVAKTPVVVYTGFWGFLGYATTTAPVLGSTYYAVFGTLALGPVVLTALGVTLLYKKYGYSAVNLLLTNL